jgi:hypothetical protein
MASVTAKYALDEQIVEDLLELVPFADKLIPIVSAAAEAPAGSTSTAIARVVAQKVEIPQEQADQILNILQNIGRTQGRLRFNPMQMLDIFTMNVESYAKTKGQLEILKAWQPLIGTLIEVLKQLGPDHPLSIARKADRVYYAHQHVFSEGRIITDLRPVFDEAGEKVVRMIVTHSLLIDYFDGNLPHCLEIGLDATDLGDLRRACERAQGKAVALRDALKDRPWPTTLGLDDAEQ